MYEWNGAAWIRALGYAAGVLQIAPGDISLLTYFGSVDATVKASAGVVYWLVAVGSAAETHIELRDGGAAGTIKYLVKSPAGRSIHALIFPPIKCATNIYIDIVSGDAGARYIVGYL